MINFWAAWKRDFSKISAAALAAVFLMFALNFAASLTRRHGFGAALTASYLAALLTEVVSFGFYCLLAVFFFDSKKGGLAELAEKYFYVPVILAVFSFIIDGASAYMFAYAVRNIPRLTVANFVIPYSWTPIPFIILGAVVSFLIVFVFIIAVVKSVSWFEACGIVFKNFKTLFAAFVWWKFCAGIVSLGATFAAAYALSLAGYAVYAMYFKQFVSLILGSLIIYYVFQKINGGEIISD